MQRDLFFRTKREVIGHSFLSVKKRLFHFVDQNKPRGESDHFGPPKLEYNKHVDKLESIWSNLPKIWQIRTDPLQFIHILAIHIQFL